MGVTLQHLHVHTEPSTRSYRRDDKRLLRRRIDLQSIAVYYDRVPPEVAAVPIDFVDRRSRQNFANMIEGPTSE